MKTKHWSILAMLILVLGTAISFSSCGNDDDMPTPNDPTNNENNNENNNGNDSGTNTLTKVLSAISFNRKYLSNISADKVLGVYHSREFSYSSNKLFSFVYEYNGNKRVLTYTDGAYRTDDDRRRISKLETNQSGFITLLILESGGYEADTCNFYYSERNLSKITRSYRGGVTYRLIETYDFEWKNGNIDQVKMTSTRIEHSDESTGQRTDKIFYDQKQNVNRQYPYIVTSKIVGSNVFAGLLNIGLLGDGPELLPSSVKIDANSQNSVVYGIATQTNSDGLITSESAYENYDDGTVEKNYEVDFTYIDAN